MTPPPSIYVLRKPIDPIPERDKLLPGDVIVMSSGDVLVWTGAMLDLLPGRYASIEELKEFLSYIASGWPDDPETARADLGGKVPEMFLERMLTTVSKLSAGPGQAGGLTG
jgi:hypothetical protein